MPENNEEEFKVVDRRRLLTEEAQAEQPASSEDVKAAESENRLEVAAEVQPKIEPSAQTQEAAGKKEAGRHPHLVQAVQIGLKVLTDNAMLLFGVIPHPESGQSLDDKAQAKLALQCAGDTLSALKIRFSETEQREIRAAVLETLRIAASQAYLCLGLVPHPETGKSTRDLPRARLSIDFCQLLFETLQGHLSELEKKEVRGLISELQIQFVGQAKQGPMPA